MGSQFVDFNADGHTDYISATFDGSPYVSFGSKRGWTEPEHILDAKGQRLLISSIWDYDAEKHSDLGRSLPDEKSNGVRCISALAFDWDNDGDYDLLLGSYEEGRLYRQMNEGTNTEPKFTGQNIPVLAGGDAFALPAKMTTPTLVDWDSDGDMDLIAGTFGGSRENETSGAVYLSINTGSVGAPAFGPLQTLIAPHAQGGTEPSGPDIGLYPAVADLDGDGDLDLIVGAYSVWTPDPRELTAAETLRVTELEAQIAEFRATMAEVYQAIQAEVEAATEGTEGEEADEIADAIRDTYEKEQLALFDTYREASEELRELVPSGERSSFVWLYERL
jgi:hypothetical protein